jgi:hypothetical protein
VIRHVCGQPPTIAAEAKGMEAAGFPTSFEKLLPCVHVPKAERPIPAGARKYVASRVHGHPNTVVVVARQPVKGLAGVWVTHRDAAVPICCGQPFPIGVPLQSILAFRLWKLGKLVPGVQVEDRDFP